MKTCSSLDLLRAAVWPDLRGRRALERCHPAEHQQSPLLPLLSRHLSQWNADAGWMQACRVAQRQCWFRNEQFFHRTRELLGRLSHPPVLLKGSALALAYYAGDSSLRPMGDVDLWTEHPASTLQELKLDFAPRDYSPDYADFETWHAFPLLAGGFELDVHAHFLNERCLPELNQELRRTARPIPGWPALALAPAEQLLHIVSHALRYQKLASPLWLADAHRVLHFEPDWQRLRKLAARFRLGYTLAQGLRQLREALEVELPAGLLEQLEGDAGRLERWEFHLKSRPPGRFGNLACYLVRYPLLERLRGRLPTPWGLAEYLRKLLGCRRYAEVPAALSKLSSRAPT